MNSFVGDLPEHGHVQVETYSGHIVKWHVCLLFAVQLLD